MKIRLLHVKKVMVVIDITKTNLVDKSFKHGKNFKMGNFCIIGKNIVVGDNVTIGDYCKIMDGCKIGNNTLLKDHIRFAPHTIVGKDCVIDSFVKSSGMNHIGNNVTLRYDAIIAREVTIEDDVFVSPQVMTIYKTAQREKLGGIIMGKGSFIGTNVTISHGVKIGPECIIGSKALVTKDCLEKGIYVGVPAKLIRKLD